MGDRIPDENRRRRWKLILNHSLKDTNAADITPPTSTDVHKPEIQERPTICCIRGTIPFYSDSIFRDASMECIMERLKMVPKNGTRRERSQDAHEPEPEPEPEPVFAGSE